MIGEGSKKTNLSYITLLISFNLQLKMSSSKSPTSWLIIFYSIIVAYNQETDFYLLYVSSSAICLIVEISVIIGCIPMFYDCPYAFFLLTHLFLWMELKGKQVKYWVNIFVFCTWGNRDSYILLFQVIYLVSCNGHVNCCLPPHSSSWSTVTAKWTYRLIRCLWWCAVIEAI